MDLADRLEFAGVGRPENAKHSNGVLVAACYCLFCGDHVAARLHRHVAGLYIPITTEFLPDHLDVRTEDEIGAIGRLAGCRLTLAPLPLHRHSREHDGLAGTDGRDADRLLSGRSMEEIGDHVHASPLDLGRLRVFVFVDHVLVERFGHQLLGLWFHPGGYERREVQTGVAVEHQLFVNDLVRDLGCRFLLRQAILGNGPDVEARRECWYQLGVYWVVIRFLLVDHGGNRSDPRSLEVATG